MALTIAALAAVAAFGLLSLAHAVAYPLRRRGWAYSVAPCCTELAERTRRRSGTAASTSGQCVPDETTRDLLELPDGEPAPAAVNSEREEVIEKIVAGRNGGEHLADVGALCRPVAAPHGQSRHLGVRPQEHQQRRDEGISSDGQPQPPGDTHRRPNGLQTQDAEPRQPAVHQQHEQANHDVEPTENPKRSRRQKGFGLAEPLDLRGRGCPFRASGDRISLHLPGFRIPVHDRT